jgi:CheY-like chemotaxis protein
MSMDLSDALRTAAAVRSQPPAWRLDAGALAGRLGEEIAAPLSAALERVLALSACGAIDRHGLNALRDEIERARRVGIMGQQLGRLAAGQVRQQPEPLDLAQMLCQAVQQRSAETGARDIGLRQLRRPAIVSADATLLYALLQALLDWCFEHSRSRIEFHVELRHWPVQARLLCSFAWREADAVDRAAACEPEDPCRPDEPSEPQAAALLDSVSWQLLQRMATLLGVQLERESSDWQTLLEIVFPAALTVREPTLAEVDAQAAALRPLPPGVAVGSRVLVLAERAELRHLVRESLRRFALTVDFVASSEEASAWCSESPPQALVYEAGLAGAEPLRRRLQAGPTRPAFVRVAAEGDTCDVAQRGAEETITIGREAIVGLLPAALLHELSRVHGAHERSPA